MRKKNNSKAEKEGFLTLLSAHHIIMEMLMSLWLSFNDNTLSTSWLLEVDLYHNFLCMLSLSIFQYSIFASILTTGGMVGAVTSGHLSDYIGRKGVISKIFLIHQISRFNYVYNLLILFLFCMMQAMRISAVVCIIGWLAIYFAKVVATKLAAFFINLLASNFIS